MAISHIASIRGSARMAAQRAAAGNSEQEPLSGDQLTGDNQSGIESEYSLSTNMEHLQVNSLHDPNTGHTQNDLLRATNRQEIPTSLDVLTGIRDIESHSNHNLSQIETLSRLEQRWFEITQNLETVIGHLESCNAEITEVSVACLQSLNDNIETTCDKVDLELKAQYQLMTKCDELTTKLAIASSFRDEIKTLRKSVETLERLYRTKLVVDQQKKLSEPNR